MHLRRRVRDRGVRAAAGSRTVPAQLRRGPAARRAAPAPVPELSAVALAGDDALPHPDGARTAPAARRLRPVERVLAEAPPARPVPLRAPARVADPRLPAPPEPQRSRSSADLRRVVGVPARPAARAVQ